MIKPGTPDALRLMMEGSAALADAEHNGMRIDVPYLDRMIKESGEKIGDLATKLRKDEIYVLWRNRFSERANLGSSDQLGEVLFNIMGIECAQFTETGKPSTDIASLEGIDLPFIKRWHNWKKLHKARDTYLTGIRREVAEDGLLRPFFNLNIARTYRSSSSNPNFQNIPIRDPRMAKLIRRAFIPREGCTFVEVDYSSLEFRGAAIFWEDPQMIDYASDPTLDIHRDMASECYRLPLDQVTKDARTHAKNSFVFPILYGSYFRSCAQNLWDRISQHDLETKDGTPLHDHLDSLGIDTYQKFEDHIKRVEEHFNERFPHWSEAKKEWWDKYLKRGWFPLKTGFVCSGVYSYNDLMNYPIQGPSFHCLLWSLIQINKWLKKNKMETKLIGQIHDSVILDVKDAEFDDVLSEVNSIMTRKIRDHWKWIVVPLEVEAEAARTNWYEKKEVDLSGHQNISI